MSKNKIVKHLKNPRAYNSDLDKTIITRKFVVKDLLKKAVYCISTNFLSSFFVFSTYFFRGPNIYEISMSDQFFSPTYIQIIFRVGIVSRIFLLTYVHLDEYCEV